MTTKICAISRRILHKSRWFLAFTAVLNLSVITPASASVGDEMQSYFDDAGARANITGPSAFQGQSAGYYSGGNVWTRFPQKSVQPFNLQLPGARAGCGGIDLFAGSFSFINTAELVAMLKATANNAIGFAFQLAIDAISPQISGVIKDMSQKVQQLNQMNISSCETAQGLVGGLWPVMDTTQSTICEAVGNDGIFSDWAASRQGCNNGGKRKETLAANTNPEMEMQLVGQDHNFTWDILNKAPQFAGYDQEFKEMVMTIVGTVVTQVSDDPTKGSIIDKHGPGDDSIVEALLDGTQGGNTVKILKCVDSDKCLEVTTQNMNIPASQAIRPKVKALILSMATAIKDDTAIGDAEKTLLNVASLPLYKILAVQTAARTDIVGTGEIDAVSEITSIDLLQAILNDVLGKFDMAKVGLVKADQDSAAAWAAQVQGVRTKFAQREVRNSARVEVTMRVIDRTIALESTLQNSMSPGMSAALNFSRGLNSQGLR
ncbi:MAG: conjugal transfer protein TraH [Sphingopyxis sp.]|jgi:conjugative transfer pilus assembly protein TraH|nr:MAG: conjugal transfer protein TraH [Sphingopyxis sp.]